MLESPRCLMNIDKNYETMPMLWILGFQQKLWNNTYFPTNYETTKHGNLGKKYGSHDTRCLMVSRAMVEKVMFPIPWRLCWGVWWNIVIFGGSLKQIQVQAWGWINTFKKCWDWLGRVGCVGCTYYWYSLLHIMVDPCIDILEYWRLDNWLVVWNINFIFPYIGNNHPNWLIFFRGVQTTNQLGVDPILLWFPMAPG